MQIQPIQRRACASCNAFQMWEEYFDFNHNKLQNKVLLRGFVEDCSTLRSLYNHCD
jgi:hypothetical protein